MKRFFPFLTMLVLVLWMSSCSDAIVGQSGAHRTSHHQKPVRGHRSRKQVRHTLGFVQPASSTAERRSV